jgi:hypothetical protein
MILEGPRRDIHRSCSTSSGLLLYIFYSSRAAQHMGPDEEK